MSLGNLGIVLLTGLISFTPILSLSGRTIAAESDAPPATRGLGEMIEGLRRLEQHFAPDRSYRVAFDEETAHYDTDHKPIATNHLKIEYSRRGSLVLVRRDIDYVDRNLQTQEWINWKDGICLQRKDDAVFLWPFLIAQGWDCYSFHAGLFVDAWHGLEWGSPAMEASKPAKNQSEYHALSLPRLIEEHQEQYHVRPRLEKVDGVWCHVLERPDRDLIWVDTDRGFVTRHRKFWAKKDLPACEFFNKGLKQISAGFWLPTEQREDYFFGPLAQEQDREKVRRTAVRKILSVDFKTLSDQDFEVPLKDLNQFLVSDTIRGVTFIRHPDDIEPLNQVLSDAREAVETSSVSRWWIMNGIVLGLASTALLARKLGQPWGSAPVSGLGEPRLSRT